jgi:hypothetical protein
MDIYVVDNEILTLGMSLKARCDDIGATLDSYLQALRSIHTYAITGNDLIRPKIAELIAEVEPLVSKCDDIGQRAQDSCSTYIVQIDADDGDFY